MTTFTIFPISRGAPKSIRIYSDGGSTQFTGIRAVRASLAQIRASNRTLQPSTVKAHDLYRAIIAEWDARRLASVHEG